MRFGGGRVDDYWPVDGAELAANCGPMSRLIEQSIGKGTGCERKSRKAAVLSIECLARESSDDVMVAPVWSAIVWLPYSGGESYAAFAVSCGIPQV